MELGRGGSTPQDSTHQGSTFQGSTFQGSTSQGSAWGEVLPPFYHLRKRSWRFPPQHCTRRESDASRPLSHFHALPQPCSQVAELTTDQSLLLSHSSTKRRRLRLRSLNCLLLVLECSISSPHDGHNLALFSRSSRDRWSASPSSLSFLLRSQTAQPLNPLPSAPARLLRP
jgi:hypothetical protein